MGFPSELRDAWVSKSRGFLIASPEEDQKKLRMAACTQGLTIRLFRCCSQGLEAIHCQPVKGLDINSSGTVIDCCIFCRLSGEGVRAGAKAAAIACVASAVPTLVAVRVVPWAKANLNYTAQALIVSAASIAAYFITADKTILECARRNAVYDKTA